MLLKFNIDIKLDKKKTVEQAKLVLFFAMLKMQELAVLKVAVDRGRLKSSIKIFPTSPGAEEYVLYDGVDYGIDIEFGTSPHYVSAEELKGWARRVLGDENAAFPVAKKIGLSGTDAQPFFRPALHQVQDIWVERLWQKYLSK